MSRTCAYELDSNVLDQNLKKITFYTNCFKDRRITGKSTDIILKLS